MSDLPPSWEWVTLGNILQVRYGKALSKDSRSDNASVPVVASAGVMAYTTMPLTHGPTIVIGRKGNVGSIQEFERGTWPIDTVFYAEVPNGIDIRFLGHQLRYAQLSQYDSSTSTPSLRREDLESVRLAIPPSIEQRRIVAALEDHLSRLDAGKQALDAVRRRLSRLRSDLLDDLFNSAASCPMLPLGQLIQEGRRVAYGVLVPGPHVPDGVPIVRVGDLLIDNLDPEQLKRIDPSIAAQFPRTLLRGGELLISLVGTIGRASLASKLLTGANTARAVGVFPLDDARVNPRWALAMIKSRASQRYMSDAANEVARKTLNLAEAKNCPIPIPSLDLQDSLVEELEINNSRAQILELAVNKALARVRGLRKSLLFEAFAGRLVPQNSNDEPASVLLERIRTERAAQPRPKRTRRAKNSSQETLL